MVAVRLERPHAKCLGQGEGFPVASDSGLNLRRLMLRRHLAEESQGVGFMAAFLVLTGEIEGAMCLGVRLV